MDNGLVDLRPQIIDHGPKVFMQYQIKGWVFNKTHVGRHFKLDVSVKLGRDLSVILLVTFLPTLLMNLLNQASTYLTMALEFLLWNGGTFKKQSIEKRKHIGQQQNYI